MQLNSDVLGRVTYLVGAIETVSQISNVSALAPFDEKVIGFLNDVSRILMKDARSKAYPDVVTFAFWIRKASLLKLKERFGSRDGLRLGKGVVFHIAPSNVPTNFAYSLASGLLCGNANMVRVPGKAFPQISVIIDAVNKSLEEYGELKPYMICIRYERDKEVNDLFSSIADMRIVWGGDQTIAELRRSPLPPRSGEITFADRYSLAVIDSDAYISLDDKDKVAEDFYNDTFLSDQNACTSPQIVVWLGGRIKEAKDMFWKSEHRLVKKKYNFQPIQGVDKLASAYLLAAGEKGVKVQPHEDNLIVRVAVSRITEKLMDYKDNSGYFLEYDCKDIMELAPLCNDKRCQTVAYIGSSKIVLPLITAGVKGIDRIVPVGRTMDFDLVWDGYNLPEFLTRTVVVA